MKSRVAGTIFVLLAGFAVISPFDRTVPRADAADADSIETIVLVRHGEKPPAGLGQLNCQGLNRALALPAVLRKAFGQPAAIFAPNPSEQKTDGDKLYDYVRPLATIEPAAIEFGLPVHTGIGQSRIDDLRRQLDSEMYHNSYVLVAWEHTEAMLLARALMTEHGGDPKSVPDWKGNDFDSIYVVKIHRSGPAATAVFVLGHEGLDGQPSTCPGAAG